MPSLISKIKAEISSSVISESDGVADVTSNLAISSLADREKFVGGDGLLNGVSAMHVVEH